MPDEKIRTRLIERACTVAVVLLFSVALLLAGSPFAGCKSSPPAPDAKPAGAEEPAADRQDRVAVLFKDDPESYKIFQSVQEDYRTSRFEEAVNKLETLLAQSPNAPWAEVVQFQLAQSFRVQGRSQEALQHLDLFLERYPVSPEAPYALLYKGEVLLASGKERKGPGGVTPMSRFYLNRALRVFRDIQQTYPEHRDLLAQAVLLSGSTYEELEDSDHAAAMFRRVADEFTDTDYPARALFALAGVLLREGDVEAAERAFGEVTDRLPNSEAAKRAMTRLAELGLVGYPAAPLVIKEWIGEPPPEVKDMKGKATLINFWAIWCPHCKRSIPRLNDIVRTYGERGLNVVGISREREQFEADRIREYVRTNPMLFPTGVDDGARTSAGYAVTGIPRVVLVDAQGRVRWHGHPDYLSEKVIEKVMEQGAGS